MRTSYAKIDRRIQSHWLWSDKPFARGQAWLDLILLAAYRDHKQMIGGVLTDIHRGEVWTTIAGLSERWGWSRGKTTRFLDDLKTDTMVSIKRTQKITAITIENYETYQCDYSVDGHKTDTETDTPRTRQKKDNKDIKKVVVDARAREGCRWLSDRLSDDEWNRLDRQFDDMLPLIDRIDNQVVQTDGIENPYSYILTAANRMNWPRKS